ncbi:MAG: type II toxin-antitoxin system VapC family toxin [Candidatus Micrarchaeota archaeon]
MYVLDTSAAIEILNNTPAGAKVKKAIGNAPFVISSITAFEVLAGTKEQEREKTFTLIENAETLEFDKESAKISAKIAQQLKQRGKTINPLYTCIAGNAMKYNAELVTLDRDFERIPNLKAIIVKK